MIGLGTILNTAGVLAGGLLGLLFGKAMKDSIRETVIKANGLCVLFIGISGVLDEMFTVENGRLSAHGTMRMAACLALGAFIGELINIDGLFERFGEWLKKKTGSSGEKSFVNGFVTTSLTVCIGAMAIVGAIQDGLHGDYSLLAVKSVLDLVTVLIMTASLGKGCIFSVIPVILIQGLFTLCAKFIEPIMTEAALSNLSLTGSVLIFAIGLNLVLNTKIRVANMLPAIVLSVIWSFVPFLHNL